MPTRSWARSSSHGGGYPGFGSHMAWHPATGLGVIGLGNLRYAPVRPVVAEQLRALVLADAVPRRRVRPTAPVEALRAIAEGLLERWDDARRRRGLRDEHGPRRATRRSSRGAPSGSRTTWARSGATPHGRRSRSRRPTSSGGCAGTAAGCASSCSRRRSRDPRIQRLELTPVHDPSRALTELAERVLAVAGSTVPAWPADLVAGPDVDATAVERSLRAAAARFGPMRLGLPTAGDGRTTATFDVDGDDGRAGLAHARDRSRRRRRDGARAGGRGAGGAGRGLVARPGGSGGGEVSARGRVRRPWPRPPSRAAAAPRTSRTGS